MTLTHAEARAAAAPERRAGRRRAQNRDQLIGYAMVAAPVLGVLVFGMIPFGMVVWYSLHEWSPLTAQLTFAGLDNYRRMLSDPVVANSLVRTAVFVVVLTVTQVALGLVLALLLNRRVRGIGLFRTAYFAPVIVSLAAWTVIWNYLLALNGGINGVLALFGVNPINWLGDSRFALMSIVIVALFKGVGLMVVIFLGALQGVPAELREAASLDGANAFRIFWNVTFPLISPTTLLVTILTVLNALNVFATVEILTGGGPSGSTNLLSFLLYQTAFVRSDFGYASAIGVLLFLITLAVTLVQWYGRKRWVHGEV